MGSQADGQERMSNTPETAVGITLPDDRSELAEDTSSTGGDVSAGHPGKVSEQMQDAFETAVDVPDDCSADHVADDQEVSYNTNVWGHDSYEEFAPWTKVKVDLDWESDTILYRDDCWNCGESVSWFDKLRDKHWDRKGCPKCGLDCTACKCPTCEDCDGGVIDLSGWTDTGYDIQENGERWTWICECPRCTFCAGLKIYGQCRVCQTNSFHGLTRILGLSEVRTLRANEVHLTSRRGVPISLEDANSVMVVPDMYMVVPDIPKLIRHHASLAILNVRQAVSLSRAQRYIRRRVKKLWLEFQWCMNERRHVDVKTEEAVKEMMRALSETAASMPGTGIEPMLAFDMEAVDLGRWGKDCYIQVRDLEKSITYLIDLIELGPRAFQHPGPDGTTLQNLLENDSIKKLIWDVRKDSEALFFHYGIKLQGIIDVQIMEMLNRGCFQARRPKAATSISFLKTLTDYQQHHWKWAKNFKFNGDYSVFAQRPVDPALVAYAVTDVRFLLNVYEEVLPRLGDNGIRLGYAMEWSREEVSRSQDPCRSHTEGLVHRDFRKYWIAKELPQGLGFSTHEFRSASHGSEVDDVAESLSEEDVEDVEDEVTVRRAAAGPRLLDVRIFLWLLPMALVVLALVLSRIP